MGGGEEEGGRGREEDRHILPPLRASKGVGGGGEEEGGRGREEDRHILQPLRASKVAGGGGGGVGEGVRGVGVVGGGGIVKKDATSGKHKATLTESAMTPSRQTSRGTPSALKEHCGPATHVPETSRHSKHGCVRAIYAGRGVGGGGWRADLAEEEEEEAKKARKEIGDGVDRVDVATS